MRLVHFLFRMRAASGGRSGRMRMPVQENASTQIAARILADVKSHLSAEHASKAAARAQAERSSTPARAFQGSLGQETPQVKPDWGCVAKPRLAKVCCHLSWPKCKCRPFNSFILSARGQDSLKWTSLQESVAATHQQGHHSLSHQSSSAMHRQTPATIPPGYVMLSSGVMMPIEALQGNPAAASFGMQQHTPYQVLVLAETKSPARMAGLCLS